MRKNFESHVNVNAANKCSEWHAVTLTIFLMGLIDSLVGSIQAICRRSMWVSNRPAPMYSYQYVGAAARQDLFVLGSKTWSPPG